MTQSEKSFVRNYALTCYPFDVGEREEDIFIAKLIFKYMRGERVLDLGCGPVVLTTSIFYPRAKEVVAVDRLQTNLDFVKHNAHELGQILERAKKYRKQYLSKTLISPKIRLVKGDVTKRISNLGLFDSVMNLGCFGALDTAEQFQAAVDNAYSYLKKGGTLLMINWIGKNKRPYKFNGTMSAITDKIYLPSMKKAGFNVKEIHLSSRVLSDETRALGYTKIVWAVSKK